MKHLPVLLILAAGTPPVNAQGTFAGPLTGYIFDELGRSIRPILGTPGAAYLGSPNVNKWDNATVSPNGKMALVNRRNIVSLISDITRQDRTVALTRSAGASETVVWSLDSTAAVLYSAASNRLQRITGLGSRAVVEAPVDLSFVGTLSGWCVSPDGRSIALSSGASATASVHLISDASAAPALLGSLGDPGICSFSSDGKSLFVLDRAVERIVRLRLSDGSVQGSFDVGFVPGVRALQSSTDGSLLYAAGLTTLAAINLATSQTVWSQPLDMPPDSLTPLSTSPEIFVLNLPRQDGAPIWLLDGRTAQVFFVPSDGTAGYATR